jgi:hypothetical protein
MSLAAVVARLHRAKNLYEALPAGLAEWRADVVVDAVSLEALAGLVCKVAQHQRRKQQQQKPGAAVLPVWLTAVKHYCAGLVRVCRGGAVTWEQSTLQAVAGSLLRLHEWLGPSIAVPLLRCLSRVLCERGHLLGKDLQDSVMALALPRARVNFAAPVARDTPVAEDVRDGQVEGAASEDAGRLANLEGCAAALLCINDILSKVKRKSHFVDTYLTPIATTVLENVGPLADNAAHGAARTLSCNLALLESVS